MSAARVDKKWQSSGLGAYPLEAIFGTLAHYGAAVDEAQFKTLAEKLYPLGIAQGWQEQWKGTGQFGPFPGAAAQELWKRLVPDRLEPTALTEVIVKLVDALSQMAQGSAEARVGPAFEELKALKAKLPQEKGVLDPTFVEEAFTYLPEPFIKKFDELGEELAREGHEEDAEAFAQVEEYLFPERAEVATAMVKAAAGKKDEAEKVLVARAANAGLDAEARVLAVDGLIHIGSNKAALEHGEHQLDAAEKAEDHHLALALVDRLAHLYKLEGQAGQQRLVALAGRAEKLVEAHNKAHPHH